MAAVLAAATLLLAPVSHAEPSLASAEEAAIEHVASDPPVDDAEVAAEAVDVPEAASVEVDDAAAIEAVELEEERTPWTRGLMMSIAAMCIGGFSAMLGIWVDRDAARPRVFAAAMSVLIFFALVVGVAQAYLDQIDRIEKYQDLERMLDMTYEIAVASGDAELVALVEESTGMEVDGLPPTEGSAEAIPSTDGPDAATSQ
ncbi:MAG: hypothetical protein CL927_04545 [Deltaproteobacteria bacterium]|nr:hypothetical protein [Deltaproteobacteria bacterium]